MIQPSLFFERPGKSGFKESGFDARFLYVQCSRVKATLEEIANRPVISDTDYLAFKTLLRRLNAINKPEKREDFNNPIFLEMTEEAKQIFAKYQFLIRESEENNGALVGLGEIVSKQPGKVLRIAGILHCAKLLSGISCDEFEDRDKILPQNHKIDRETLCIAIYIADDYLFHAKKIFGGNGFSGQANEAANKILAFAKKEFAKTQRATFTKKQLQNQFHKTKGLITAEEREKALKVLLELGEIETTKQQNVYKLAQS